MPANITITTPPPQTATQAAQQAAAKASAAGGLLNPSTIATIFGGLVAVIVIVLLIYLAVSRRRGGRGIVEKILEQPDADAVGLLLDLDSNTAHVAPLRRIENFYVSEDPKTPAMVVSNPYTTPFNLRGKPLVIAVTAGKLGGMQVDPPSLAVLGLTRISVEAGEWEDISDPQKSFTRLLQKLVTMTGEKKGAIPLSPDTRLAFQVSPPRVVLMILRQLVERINATLSYMVNFVAALEQIATSIKEYRLREMAARRQTLATIGLVIGVILVMAGVFYMLYSMAQRGGVP